MATHPRGAGAVLLLLVALFAVHMAAAIGNVHLPVADGEFVTLHVGYPGQDVALRLRWDLDAVAVFGSVDLRGTSHTYAESDQSDVLCLGADCVRVPIYTIPAEPPPSRPDMAATRELSNYQGVLGLEAGSALRRYYPWVRYDINELELLATAPHPPSDAIYPVGGSAFAAKIGAVRCLLLPDMTSDYTMVPSAAQDNWRLDVFNANQRRAARIRIRGDHEHVHTSSDARVTTVRRAPDVVLLAAMGSDATAWNATSALSMGRLMAQELFTVVVGPDGAVLWLEPLCKHRPRIDELNYLPFVPALLMLLVIWLLGIAEDVTVARQTAAIDIEPPPMHGVQLEVGGHIVPVEQGALLQPALPTTEPWRAGSLLSFRHAGFISALGWLTALVAVLLMLCVTMGFGLGHAFHRTEMKALDLVAVYSTAGMALVLAAAALNVDTQPSTGMPFGACVPMLGLWLLAMLDQCTLVTAAALLLFSGIVCVLLINTWLAAALSILWPGISYGTGLRARGIPTLHSPRLYLFWLALTGAAALWATWLFAFYTVPYVVTSWRPAHPTAYGVGVLALIIVGVLALGMTHSHNLLITKLNAVAASRALDYANLEGERVTKAEQKLRRSTRPRTRSQQ